jgi:methanogenic corrinoid protein MtbC1
MHSFGIRMVDELFKRAGWRTLCEPNSRINDVLAIVGSESFHILGIGISSEAQVPFVKELIRQVRKTSHNRHILVMVGGSYIVEQPNLAASIGADFSASDGREAIAIAETVIYEHTHRR